MLVEGQLSSWEEVTSGIPQGSVLGPTLFLLYINDLPNMVSNCEVKIFADDTKLYKEIRSQEDCSTLQENINKIHTWSQKWQLKFHPGKCHILRIGTSQPNFEYTMPDYKSGTVSLEITTVEKDLGVNIDNKLTFSEHTAITVKKANQMLAIIRRTFRYLDEDTFLLLYKTMVRPIAEYGVPAWTPIYMKEIDALESVQRRATKMLAHLKDRPYEERLQHLKLFSLAFRRQRGDMIFVYKYLTGILNSNHQLFVRSSSNTRGHDHRLEKARLNTILRQKSFTQRVINNWNSLPQKVVEATSLNIFKSRLDKHWESYPGTYNYRDIHV